MTDAKTPEPAQDTRAPAAAGADQDRALKIPEPMQPPRAVQGGDDMKVPEAPGPAVTPTGPTGPPDFKEGEDPGINANVVSWALVEASEASPVSRRAALGAAAVLVGPVGSGTVDLRTEFAATAVLRIAEMFLPWLEGVPAEAKSGTEGKQAL